MKYISTKGPIVKDIPDHLINDIKDHLKKIFPDGMQVDTTLGQLQEALLSFRDRDGHPMLINQMAPIFLALCWGDPLE